MTNRLKAGLSAATEELWALIFALAGRLWPPAAVRWASPGDQRVVVVAPHPDDETLACAGTLIQHRRSGDDVCMIYVTDGRLSQAAGLPPERMAQQRFQEAQAAVAAMGIGRLHWLGLPEGNWTEDQFQAAVTPVLADLRPHILYVPSRLDFHPEHRKVAHALAALLAAWPERQPALAIRVYQVQVPLTPLLTNLVTDGSATAEASRLALDAHVTQQSNVARSLRMRRYAGRFYGLGKQVEEFWQMSLPDYVRLHPPDRPDQSFRGLRPYPFTDPLAYLVGLAERWRLHRTFKRGGR
ncbi:MAG: PIG-L family deacetylase [Chloroflexota bacterium]